MTNEHVIAYSFFKALKGGTPAEFWIEWNQMNQMQPNYDKIHRDEEE